jgi:AraC-like DNA-binding protein
MDLSNSTAALSVQRAEPSGFLQPFVHCYLQRDGHFKSLATVEPVIARLEQAFEFQFCNPYEVRHYGTEAMEDCPSAIIVGPQTRRRARLILQGTISAFAVMLRPAGFHRLFRLPLHLFVDCGTDAQAVLGPIVADLHERLGNAKSFAERVRLMEEFLLRRLPPQADPFAGIVGLMWRQAQAKDGDPNTRNRISVTASQTGWSTRQFERRFLQFTGVSPMVFSRIARFEAALRLKASSSFQSWTVIAHMLGYHDQMHMTREFHVLAGDSPGRSIIQVAPEHIMSALTREHES